VALVASCSSCGGKERVDPEHPRIECGAFGGSDDRSAIAFLAGDKVFVRTAAGTVDYPMPACLAEADQLFVAPGGVAVAAYGTKRSMPGDLWGHSSKVTTAECVYELYNARQSTLEDPNLFAWVGAEAIAIPIDRLPPGSRECRVFTTSGGVIAACHNHNGITLRRFAGRELERVGEDQHIATDDAGDAYGLQVTVSPDGKRLAYWGGKLRVVDLATGAQVAALDDAEPLDAFELDPTGGDRIMLVGRGEPPRPIRRVRVATFDGRITYQGGEWGNLGIYWTEPAAYWEAGYCNADRRVIN
jgi:hypothetical protein